MTKTKERKRKRKEKKERKMTVFNEDTVKVVAEMINLSNVKEEAAVALASDLEFQVRELIQVGGGVFGVVGVIFCCCGGGVVVFVGVGVVGVSVGVSVGVGVVIVVDVCSIAVVSIHIIV